MSLRCLNSICVVRVFLAYSLIEIRSECLLKIGGIRNFEMKLPKKKQILNKMDIVSSV